MKQEERLLKRGRGDEQGTEELMKQEERLLKRGRGDEQRTEELMKQEERLLKRGRGGGKVQVFNKYCTFFVYVKKMLYLCSGNKTA